MERRRGREVMYIILMLWRAMWALCEHWGKQVVVIDVILEVAFAGVVGDAGMWSRRARDGGADDVGWRRLGGCGSFGCGQGH